MNSKPILLVTRKLPDAVEQRAAKDYEVRLNASDHIYDSESLIKAAEGAHALLICNSEILNADIIKKLSKTVQIVACFTSGYEHVDIAAAANYGILVTNAPDALTDAVADLTILLLLGATRRASEGEIIMRGAQWKGWDALFMAGSAIRGKRLGIYGMGRIGRAVATRAVSFGLEIHYHNRSRLAPELEAGATWHKNVESLLECSDILSFHCPLNDQSRNFLTAERISLMPYGATVINTSRGDVVDDDALISALISGRLQAAGLDVYRGEPNNIHPEYRRLTNTFLMPHIGSATLEARIGMGFQALDNLDAFFKGLPPPNRVR